MKYALLFISLAFAASLYAQKERPGWAAGMYGSLSGGYSILSQPFKQSGTPYVYSAASGFNLQVDGGLSLRNHWGGRFVLGSYESSDFRGFLLQKIGAEYPGHVLRYLPEYESNTSRIVHYGFGLSYAIPQRRWNFQPEIFFGTTEAFSEWPTLQIKEIGTHNLLLMQFTPTEKSFKSVGISMGGRAMWYAGWYWGFFANAQLKGNWYQLPYRQIITDVLDQSVEKETFLLKKTALGASLNMGIFLQIARWEPKKG